MNVVFASGDLYSKLAIVTIKSLLMNNQLTDSITIYYIEDRVSIENKTALEELVDKYGREICFIPFPEELNSLSGSNRNGQTVFSYCYTLDCASAILTILLNGEREDAYNISNSDSIVTINDAANALAKAAGIKVVHKNPSNEEKKGYNLMTNSSLNSEKIEELGWEPHFNLAQRSENTIKFYKNIP